MNLIAPAKPTWQCHGCNRVWRPDPTHADGGTWEPSEGRLEGVPHKYCPTCLAARQAAMAGLSTSIAEVIEHPETTPTPAPEPASVASGRGRSRVIAAVIVAAAVIAGGVIYATVRSRSDKTEPGNVEKSAGGGVQLVAPVGGAWMAPGDRGSAARPGTRAGSRDVPPAGNVGPASVREPWGAADGAPGSAGGRQTHSSGPAGAPNGERPGTSITYTSNGEGASSGETTSFSDPGASFSPPVSGFPEPEPDAEPAVPVVPEPPGTLPGTPEPVVPPEPPQPEGSPVPMPPVEIPEVPPQ